MEPIVLKSVPEERFTKVCYICEEKGRDSVSNCLGACMRCNKFGCRQHFHVTCAQGQGLLCEESGSSGDNIKYCGYCDYHYRKLKKDSSIKTIPAFNPIPTDMTNSVVTPEKCSPGNIKLSVHGTPDTTGTGQETNSCVVKQTGTVVQGLQTSTNNAFAQSQPFKPCSNLSCSNFKYSAGGNGSPHDDSPTVSPDDREAGGTPAVSRCDNYNVSVSYVEHSTVNSARISDNKIRPLLPIPHSRAAHIGECSDRNRKAGTASDRATFSGGYCPSVAHYCPGDSDCLLTETSRMCRGVEPVILQSPLPATVNFPSAVPFVPTSVSSKRLKHNRSSSVFGGRPCFQTHIPHLPTSDAETSNPISFARPMKNADSCSRDYRENSGSHSMPVSMDDLLSRQWEQSAALLLSQCSKFDIVDILTEMHNLKQENSKLEDTVNELKGHRDHLLRMNRVLAGLHAGNGDCSSSPSCNPSSTDTQQDAMDMCLLDSVSVTTTTTTTTSLPICPSNQITDSNGSTDLMVNSSSFHFSSAQDASSLDPCHCVTTSVNFIVGHYQQNIHKSVSPLTSRHGSGDVQFCTPTNSSFVNSIVET